MGRIGTDRALAISTISIGTVASVSGPNQNHLIWPGRRETLPVIQHLATNIQTQTCT
jgi:hypothetical protein